MSEVQQTIFTVIRQDRPEVDPKTVVGEGLRIGRLADSDIWLNHPLVSRLHAGINRVEDDFYLINLSASSATTLNGRVVPFNEIETLADGDEIQIGPFFLSIDEADVRLDVTVSLDFAVSAGAREPVHKREAHEKQLTLDSGALRTTTGSLALPESKKLMGRRKGTADLSNALKVFWGKRTREKAGRPSPLHPRTPPKPGKMRFNWVPTRDLIRPWPFAIFTWAAILVATVSGIAVLAHKNAFAPNEPISSRHTLTSFALTPPIAKAPNGNSCRSCHAFGVSARNRERMNEKCAACHQTESFVATIIPAHREAGIGCTNCHTEHRGENFRPLHAALESCAQCHNDRNKRTYNGKAVHTPHGGTYGYPVADGKWIWKGLDAEELAQKPELTDFINKSHVKSTETNDWRNAQFHGIHLNHLRVVPGIEGILDDDGSTVLSCSSCHRTGYMGANVDRRFPPTTCGKCHNAQVFNEPVTSARKSDTPSCTSCHVQHVRDAHWAASLRAAVADASK